MWMWIFLCEANAQDMSPQCASVLKASSALLPLQSSPFVWRVKCVCEVRWSWNHQPVRGLNAECPIQKKNLHNRMTSLTSIWFSFRGIKTGEIVFFFSYRAELVLLVSVSAALIKHWLIRSQKNIILCNHETAFHLWSSRSLGPVSSKAVWPKPCVIHVVFSQGLLIRASLIRTFVLMSLISKLHWKN